MKALTDGAPGETETTARLDDCSHGAR